MFGVIRIIFWSILFGLLILIMKNNNRLTKKTTMIVLISTTLLGTLSGLFPFENYFIEFSTPEQAFNYMNLERAEITIDGQESTLVIAKEGNSDYIYLIIPKSINSWKLGIGMDTKLKNQIIDNDIVMNLYQYKNSSDYYLSIQNMSDNKIEITDSYDSKFIAIDNDEVNKNYIAYVSNCNVNYWLKINNQKYSFSIEIK